ncbi:Ig-like domain-containing protein [Atlantibacter hermannii]|uniref:Ig-like domain-containing protein n=1 Tax=Atlantibacter hermannii TaxID=565 RepID=UPI002FF64D05
MSKTLALVIRGKDGKNTVYSTSNNKTITLHLNADDKCLLKNADGNASPEKITLKRVGKALYIIQEGETEPCIIIDNYYDESISGVLLGTTESGELSAYIPAEITGYDSVAAINDGVMAPARLSNDSLGSSALFFSGAESSHGFTFGLAGWLAALAGAAGIGIATSHQGGGKNHHHNQDSAPLPTPWIDTSSFKNGNVINDSSVSIHGTGTPGNTLSLYENGIVIATVTVGPDGNWSFTPAIPFIDGAHSITAIESDAAGHQSAPCSPVNFFVDTVAPGARAFEHVTDNVGGVTGEIASNTITDDTRPVFSGSGESGCKIFVYDNGVCIGETTVDATGHWSFQPAVALTEGAHSISLVQVAQAGNAGPVSDTRTFSIAAGLPQPAFDQITDRAGDVVGPITNGAVTDDPTPELNGTGTPGSIITVYDRDMETGEITAIGSTTVADDGCWSLTPSQALCDGEHAMVVVAEDAAGNKSEPSNPMIITVDTTPAQVMIVKVVDNAGEVKGELCSGDITDDTRPVIMGSGKPGGIVTIHDGSRVLGSVSVMADGSWAFKPDEDLDNGVHTFSVTITDLTGNTASSSAFTLTVGTPARNVVITDDTGNQSGVINDQGITDDARPTISGESDPGSTIIIYDNGTEIGTTTADADGNWSFTPESALDDGEHAISVKVIDTENNAGAEIPIATITIDTTLPDAASEITIMAGDEPISDGEATSVTNPTLSGEAEPGSTVVIYDNGTEIGSVTVDENGNWSFTPETALDDGEHTFTVDVTDPAGNTSPATSAGTITIDTTAPAAASEVILSGDDQPLADGASTKDSTPTVSGEAEPGSIVVIYDNGVEIGSVTSDADGNWSFTPETALADGEHTFTVNVTDPAGNTSPSTSAGTITIDTTAPAAASEVTLSGDNQSLSDGASTKDATPTLSGEAEPGSTVVIYDNGTEIGSVTADADGNWSFTPETALTDGEHAFTVDVTDPAGNTSPATAAGTITIDSTAPAAASEVILSGDDQPLADGASTKDSTPTVSGEAEAGSIVVIYDNGVEIGSVTADADGSWSFTPATALDDGEHTFTVNVTDPAGNTSPATSAGTITIDTTAPAAASEVTLSGDDQPLADGASTKDSMPTISGEAEPGSIVVIYDNGTEIGTVTADADGNWSFTPETALDDGEHTFTVNVTDPAGNTSPSTSAGTITIDTTAPAAASEVILSGDDQTLADGASTKDTTPTVSGEAEAGSTVVIYDNGVEIGTVTADENGNWSFTPQTALDDGEHTFTVNVTDAAGNTSPSTSAGTITIDTSAPAVADNVTISANDQTLADGASTQDTTPTVSGEAEPGSTVVIYDNGTEIGSVTADENGNWSFTPETALDDGEHAFTVNVTDAAGNTSPATAAGTITIDTTAPAAASEVTLSGDDQTLADGASTQDNMPTVSGEAEPGSTVVIYDNGVEIGSVTADADGNWSFTPETTLDDGEHAFTVDVTDPAGNTSPSTTAGTITIDTTAPAAASEVTLSGDDQTLADGASTKDNTPTLSGEAEPGSTVVIYDNGVEIGTVTADENGNWSFTPATTLDDGEHAFTVNVTDPAGNTSPATAAGTITIDTTAPAAASEVTLTGDNQPLADGASTKDTTPTVSGEAEAGSTVVIYDNGEAIGTVTADENGNWSFTPETALDDGEHAFTVNVTDPAGNTSPATAAGTITIDTTAPAAASEITLSGDDQSLSDGASTQDTTPTISGEAEPGSTVVIYDNGTEIGTVTADENGNWSFTPETALDDGEHTFTVNVTDAAGNTSPATAAGTITIDTSAPAVADNVTISANDQTLADGASTKDSTPTLSGEAEAGSTVVIYDNGVEIGSVTADADGNWSFTPETALDDGEHTFTVNVTDPAGNTSPSTSAGTITIDTTAPAAASEVTLSGDDQSLSDGASTQDTMPTISGEAEPGSTVVIYDNGNEIGSVTADENGNWSFTPQTALDDGEHAFTVNVTDPAGNTSPATSAGTITIDTTAPAAADNVTISANDQTLADGASTKDNTPTLSGEAEAGSTVVIYDNGEAIGTVTADENGNWSFTPETALDDGEHAFTVNVTDVAGNTSPSTSAGTITIDTSAPAVADNVTISANDQTLADGASTKDNTPTLSGEAEAGSTVVIYDNGTEIGSVTADADGNWSFTPETALDDGEHAFTVEVNDPAGNTSPATAAGTITIDTTAPAAASEVTLSGDGQTLADGASTKDSTPTVSGEAEAGSIVVIYDNGVEIGTVTADADGNWSFTPATALDDGEHAFTVNVTDAAGNTSPATAAGTITIDTTAPAAASEVTLTGDNQPLADGASTKDTTPTVSGEAEAGSTVVIYDNGEAIGTVTADENGNWSFTPETALDIGEHAFTVNVTDPAGNTSPATAAGTITIDTTAPAAASEITLSGDDQSLSDGASTQDTTPTISGEAEPGSTVVIYDNGTEIGTVTADENGNWSFTPETALTDGEHAFTVNVTDAAGNTSPSTAAGSIIIDTTPPGASDIVITDNTGPVSGTITEGGVTDDTTPTISGKTEPGSSVVILDNGVAIGTVIADADGNWSFTPETALDDGEHALTLTITDPSGNNSNSLPAGVIVIDTSAPAAATSLLITDDVGTKTGALTNGSVTDDSKPTISGKAEKGSTITLYDGETAMGTTTADAEGNWSFTPETALGDGEHSIIVKVTDGAGNTSAASDTIVFTVDTVAQAASDMVITDNAGNQKGPLSDGAMTDDNQPVISGKAEAGSTVTIFNGDTVLGTTTADETGAWQFTPATPLNDGSYEISVIVTDSAGNNSAASPTIAITVDTTAPEGVKDVAFSDDVGSITGSLGNNGVTDDSKPAISGTADANSTIAVFDNGVEIGTATSDSDGKWSFIPETALNDGEHTFTFVVTDPLGRISEESAATTLIVDTAAPATATAISVSDDVEGGKSGPLINGDITNDNQPTISGEAEAGSTITLYDGDTVIGQVTADAEGKWRFTPETALAEGEHTLTVKVSDAAGNTSAASSGITITIDSLAPASASDITLNDDVGSSKGTLTDGSVTDDNKPTLSGNAEKGSTVTIYDGETAIGTTTADEQGQWQFTPDTALADGEHSFTVKVTDTAGNTSPASSALTVMVDTLAPTAPVIAQVDDNVAPAQGSVENGKATNDTTPTFSGTAEAGSTVTLYEGDKIIGSVVTDEDGKWIFTPDSDQALTEGEHHITARATDAAGNVSDASATWSITIDTAISDAVVTISGISDDTGIDNHDFITSDDRLIITGMLDKALNSDEWVEVSLDNGATWIRAVTNDTSWTANLQESALAEGDYTIQARIVDRAGNVGDSDSHSLTISKSSTAPDVKGLSTTVKITTDTSHGITSDSKYSHSETATNSDMITRDRSVTISGTLSASLSANQYLQITLDGGNTWTTLLAGEGKDWNYILPTVTASTTFTYKLRVTDVLGNVATDTSFNDSYSVTIDISAPTAINTAPDVAKYVTSEEVFTFDNTTYGKVEAGTVVSLINDINRNGSYQEGIDQIIGYATADADGNWSLTTSLPAGPQNLAFVVWDAAGNYSTMSSVTSVGVTDGSSGSTSITANWGGTTDAENRGLNSAAVTIGQNGLWSFFQSVRGTTGGNTANAGRVYNAQNREDYNSTYLAEPSTTNGAGYNLDDGSYGHYINSAVFADLNRDGYTDVMTQISSYQNSGRTAYWIQNADGSFSPKVLDQGTLNHLGGVIAYDREGDGYLDFVLADSEADSISFIKNNGGTLSYEKVSGKDNGHPGGAIPSNLSILHEVGAVDIDNNGTIDITAHIDYNGKGDLFPGNASRGMGIIYNQTNGTSKTTFGDVGYYKDVFRNDGADDYGNLSISMTYADYNGDGWLDLFLSRGSKNGNNSDESRIYLNDGTGKLKATDSAALWFGDNMDGGTSLAVDWNHDGKMDLIEVPRQLGSPNSPMLYLNQGNNNWAGIGKSLTGNTTYTNITGAVALDYDWDGSMDLVLYRAGSDTGVVATDNNAPTVLVKNTNIAADGTSLQIRIVDGNGINTFYSNTVKLYNSKGELVATQLINPQASGSSNSMGLVSFFGLDPNEVYSVQLLRITNGAVNHVGATNSIGGYTNGTVNLNWGGLVTRQAHDAYVLTAENTGDANNTIGANGIIGTGYNDTFFSSAGDDTYNGSGGWTPLPNGLQTWSETQGLDIVDYSRAPGAINANLQTGIATGHGTDKLINIEGLKGSDAADTFTDNAANNLFEGRGGNDTFHLLNGGNDTLLYNVLKGAEGSGDGGNGHDVVYGFNVANTISSNNADIIDISELINYVGPVSFTASADGTKMELDYASKGLEDYVKVEVVGNDTVISIDRDGKGTAFTEFTPILTLANTEADLVVLLQNNQLLV